MGWDLRAAWNSPYMRTDCLGVTLKNFTFMPTPLQTWRSCHIKVRDFPKIKCWYARIQMNLTIFDRAASIISGLFDRLATFPSSETCAFVITAYTLREIDSSTGITFLIRQTQTRNHTPDVICVS